VSVWATYRQLLGNRQLTKLLLGEFVSSIGDWLYLVALVVVVYDETRDPVILGIVGAARLVPYFVLSIPAGVISDRFDRRLIRVIRVRDEASFKSETGWSPALWLYDAFVEGYGGGGVPAPWPLIAARARRPFLLAGGLTPENVAAGIAAARPDGVDVASGVESSARRKDPARVAAFIAAARGGAEALLR